MNMEKIKNIGIVSEQWLRAVGINSLAELEEIGSIETYRAIVLHGFNPGLNLLYALEGAIQGVKWTELSGQTKIRLRKSVQHTTNLPKVGYRKTSRRSG